MKKSILSLFLLAIATMLNAQNHIQTQVPIRPAGQTDVIGLTVPKMKVVRIGIVGLGMRGSDAVERWCNIEGSRIVAVCDIEPDRVEKAQKTMKKYGKKPAVGYSGNEDAWKKLCERRDIDVVYICTDWSHHTPIALYAMEHGKNTCIEVPAATTMDEIWSLINTSERTRKHCMMLENCTYIPFLNATLEMAQKGLFGDILHVEGAYMHNLDDFWPLYHDNWRLEFNRTHRGDVYPTHGIGPICQVLDIHRGDRMDYLVAMDTKSINGPKLVEKMTGEECDYFANGDHTSTMIHTTKGRTMLLEHGVTTPRPYSRMSQIVGTEGYAVEYPSYQLCFRKEYLEEKEGRKFDGVSTHSALPNKIQDELVEKYTPDFIKELLEDAKRVGGHGGIDYIMDKRLVYCLQNGLPLDMDVYDLAEWCCIAELSRISIENGSIPVAIPDFTRGAWDKVKGFKRVFAK